MKKYLLIVHGNGEGYSNPIVETFSDVDSARAIMRMVIEGLITPKKLESLVKKIGLLYKFKYTWNLDEDNYLVSITPLDNFKNYLVVMDCSYTDEITITQFTKQNLDKEIPKYGFLKEELECYEKNSTTFGGHIKVDSTYIHLQIV